MVNAMQGFEEGFEYFCKNTGSELGAAVGSEYVSNINSSIDKLVADLNQFSGYRTDASKLQGDIAEFWHADTFNIDAAVKDSKSRAYVDRSHDFASADISTNFDDKYGLKYYANGAKSAQAQAKSIFERYKEYQSHGGTDTLNKYLEDRGYTDIESILNDPIYSGQKRLIPREQLEDAIKWLREKIGKESSSRPEQVKRYQETLDLLVDRVKDSSGTESIPLSREESQKLANLAKQGRVDAKQLGLTADELITYEYILRQALKAGTTAATITIVLKVAPEIIKAISFLIQNGELDEKQFRTMGFAALSGGAEGFVRGSVSAGITVACKSGLMGEAAKSVDPSAIGMAVVLVMDTMKNAFKTACGKMGRREMADDLVRETFIASVAMLSGGVMQAVFLALPSLGFMLGSFIGSVVGGMAFSGGYNFMISFCINTGFTMFGLVRQDYSLPEDVVKEIGIGVFEYDRFEPTRFEPTRFQAARFDPTRFQITPFRPIFLRRGVIGIREIGYT